MHGRNGDVGFEGATPRVEGSSNRCCRWTWIGITLRGLESSGKGERFASPESFHPLRSSGVQHFAAVTVPLMFPRGRG
ncbi:hypothetical protein [Paenibacillus sp. JJ1722]|uniref:hypothetical protein n=1 Tax=Paenibacillus sp. JJ1722 TaxID=3398770 RepID=UPI003AAE8996